jgi:hypothetical protein
MNFGIGFDERALKMASPATKKTYKAPKKAITDQLTKSIKALRGISFKMYPRDWLK